MLIKLEKLIRKYNMKISGVIHVGAHEGQEVDDYIKAGIEQAFFFEPQKEKYDLLCKKLYPLQKCYIASNIALGSSTGIAILNKDKNFGQSSSLLTPKKHLEYYPDIVFDSQEEVRIMKLDSALIKSYGINLLVMDVQGYELEVLKGATETLKHIDYIYTELNREELYEGCAMVEDIDNYLTDFTRVETRWLRKGYGDGLYIRKTLL